MSVVSQCKEPDSNARANINTSDLELQIFGHVKTYILSSAAFLLPLFRNLARFSSGMSEIRA